MQDVNSLAVIRILLSSLDFFDLQSIELDWRVAAEHADHDFESAFGRVDFADGAVESLERSIDDVDYLAFCEVDLVFWILDVHALFNFGNFCFGNWSWRCAATDKASNAWRVADDIPGFVG